MHISSLGIWTFASTLDWNSAIVLNSPSMQPLQITSTCTVKRLLTSLVPMRITWGLLLKSMKWRLIRVYSRRCTIDCRFWCLWSMGWTRGHLIITSRWIVITSRERGRSGGLFLGGNLRGWLRRCSKRSSFGLQSNRRQTMQHCKQTIQRCKLANAGGCKQNGY